jgi:hypothetical protein
MTAEIISMAEWRRSHASRDQIWIPILLPTWPWGWWRPKLTILIL